MADKCRADTRSASVFQDDQRRQPCYRVVVVNGRNDVGRDQSDDFGVSIRRDEGARFRKLGNRLEALGNFGD